MAPFSIRIRLFVLMVAVCLTLVPGRVQAAASIQEQAQIREHIIKFYLDPALVLDLEFAKAALAIYVDDMNFILQKNTDRRLVFDPQSSVVLVSSKPHSDWARPPLPLDGFEIWAHAVRTSYSLSRGGYGGIDVSGAGVLAGLEWTRIYNPDQLAPSQVKDYWTQINNMLHELAHVFGAGYGEYYNLSRIQDTTGVAPLLNINVYDQNDAFWSDKPDFKRDPLLWNPAQIEILGASPTRQALLEFVQFSRLTAAILNGDYRNGGPLVDLSQIGIKVVDSRGSILADAKVKVWSVPSGASSPAQLIFDGFTNAAGELTFAWGGSANPHNGYDFLRLIKVFKDGYEASAAYVSIFDTDIARLVDGSPTFHREITLKAVAPFADVTPETFASSWIEALYKAGVTGGCSTNPVRFCPEHVVTRSQMAVFLERSMRGPSYLPTSAGGQVFDDVPAAYWAAAWIKQLSADGITGGCGNGKYCPELPVTRAQMAVFLLKAKHGANYAPPAAGESTGFEDVPSNYWAASWIRQLVVEGITAGCGAGKFCPDAPVTRAQMAVFLGRTFDLPE